MTVFYGIYKKKNAKKGRIAVIYETFWIPRRSAALNAFLIVCSRVCPPEEVREIEKIDCDRRYLVIYYETIEGLIEDDKVFEVKTPKKYIKKYKQFCLDEQTIKV